MKPTMDLASLPNPFEDNVVQDAWQTPTDVSEIHDDVFRACLQGIESAARGLPDSLLIYGAAGSGKTHLLTRLQRHLSRIAPQAADRVLRCVFVFVRLQTSPQLLWQHVRRRFARDLMRQDEGLTQLQRLVAHQLAKEMGTPPRDAVRLLRVLGKEDHEVVSAHLADVAATLQLPRDLTVVVDHLLCNRGVRDAAAWLMGDSLPERVLSRLDLGPDEQEDREEAARTVVTALVRLAADTLPVVFCFDQLEALQRSIDDSDALFRFGRLAADLHDADPNVFLITCLQSALIDVFAKAVRRSHLDRLAKRRALMHDLTPSQVDAIVRARLDSIPELGELRRAHPAEPHYPLPQDVVSALARVTPLVPRGVLARCARAFEERQHGRAAPLPGGREFLTAELEERTRARRATQTPAKTTAIILKGTEILSAMADAPVQEGGPNGTDFAFDGKTRVTVSVRNEADGRSLAPKLKSLLASLPRNGGARLVIVRDARLPIAKSAVKTREALAQLQAAGARIVEPAVEALAALEALASLLADAKSGDLANRGEALGRGDVLAWLRSLRDDLRLEPIQELVDGILGDEGDASLGADEQDLASFLARERVVSLEALSRDLARDASRLVVIARKNASRFLVLEGPPTVLVDVAGIASDVEA